MSALTPLHRPTVGIESIGRADVERAPLPSQSEGRFTGGQVRHVTRALFESEPSTEELLRGLTAPTVADPDFFEPTALEAAVLTTHDRMKARTEDAGHPALALMGRLVEAAEQLRNNTAALQRV